MKVATSGDRFVEFDGFRIVVCARDLRKLEAWNLHEQKVRGVDQCSDFKVSNTIFFFQLTT